VTVAAILLVYAAGAGTAGSRLLGRAGWALRAPMLGIGIYLAAAWSVVAAFGLAGLTLAIHATALGGGLSQRDLEALANVIAGLHLINLFLLYQLHEATGQSLVITLQKLAIAAAAGPQTPFTG
jgi:hypothetical protein